MYFQGRRNTCNMLRSLKQKQRNVWTSSHKIYHEKCFVGVRYQNVTKLCPPFARFIHHFPIFIFPRLPLSNISLQYKLLGTRAEFNNASAFKRSLYWCQALHITNKDRYQLTSARRPLALLNSPQVKTNGYPKRSFLFLKENVCSGYSLEAALSNVNDSFTLSRLMKQSKTFFDP